MKQKISTIHIVLFLIFFALGCSKREEVYISPAKKISGGNIDTTQPIDTISGAIKGSMKSGTIYYVINDIFINEGDTLYIPNNVTLYFLGDGKPNSSPSLFVRGTLISEGTKDKPNWFTITDSNKLNFPNGGAWGGLTCDSAENVILRWTHIEYTGAPWGDYQTESASISSSHQAIICLSSFTNLVVEDSWVSHTQDDGIYVRNAKMAIMRNTIENVGATKGLPISIKFGARGDIAYNVVIGGFNSGIKSQSLSGAPSQSIVNVYNNTIINCGFLNPDFTKGGGISFEKLVAGNAFNNLIIQNKIGMRILGGASVADTANLKHGHNLYYGTTKDIVDNFFPTYTNFIATPQMGDIYSTTPGANDPKFKGLDVAKITDNNPRVQKGLDLHLQSSSPAIGKGKTNIQNIPMKMVAPQTGAVITPPNIDLGAYPTDGSGNQH
ncbi:MAG: right-handed parallel beta-helix repeat-containing protein [Bacteroidetes bacterium]|nr:MAG: right-handed parallel beta-helix repeat-containing protein [Bacteroidota bacterium]